MAPSRGVIISNGFGKFPLAVAAVEAYRRGLLTLLLTGTYPKRRPPSLFIPGPLKEKFNRFLGRKEELPDELVRGLWPAEIVYQLGAFAAPHAPQLGRKATYASHTAYGALAGRAIIEYGKHAAIYHYRSGFGGRSLRVACARNLTLLCDHTIAHPAVIDYLVEHAGALPPGPLHTITDPVWRGVLADIDAADHIVVNSDFVAETFYNQGVSPERVHVVYAGPDEAFLEVAQRYPERCPRRGPCRLLFVGAGERRKGLDVLLCAVSKLDGADWSLDLVGPIDRAIARGHAAVLANPRVSRHGTVPRLELAEHMHRADVFVFPSLAEGSARVIPMAMALGCYVVTTPNSGSIVEDRVHGRLVQPGSVVQLRDALQEACDSPNMLSGTGARNAALVSARFRQSDYGDNLALLYQNLDSGVRG